MKKYTLILIGILACFTTIAQYDSVQLKPMPELATANIYLSTDRGERWNHADNGFPAEAMINDWVVKNTIIIAATEEHGVYISVDGLKSWQASNKGLPRSIRVKALATFNNIILAGSYREGIFLSDDEGETWRSSNTGLEDHTVRCFYVVNATILAGTDRGIYASDTGGRSWKLMKSGMQVNTFTSSGKYLYAATHQGVLRSADGGKTWAAVWNEGATITLAANKNEITGIMMNGMVVASQDYGATWVMWKNFFPTIYCPYTFQITPASQMVPLTPWKDILRLYILLPGFILRDLPASVPFSKMLSTPFGVLVAGGRGGC